MTTTASFVTRLALAAVFLFISNAFAHSDTHPITSDSASDSSINYHTSFQGTATYEGYSPVGHCTMRGRLPAYKGMVPVAISDVPYAGFEACGACIEVKGTGRGTGDTPIGGKFKAYVHSSCSECAPNDLSLSKEGSGRWGISWKFVPCENENVNFLIEGSSDLVKKVQIRGLKFPAHRMLIDGVMGLRYHDNFFVALKPAGFPASGKIEVIDVMGRSLRFHVSLDVADGVVMGRRVME